MLKAVGIVYNPRSKLVSDAAGLVIKVSTLWLLNACIPAQLHQHACKGSLYTMLILHPHSSAHTLPGP